MLPRMKKVRINDFRVVVVTYFDPVNRNILMPHVAIRFLFYAVTLQGASASAPHTLT